MSACSDLWQLVVDELSRLVLLYLHRRVHLNLLALDLEALTQLLEVVLYGKDRILQLDVLADRLRGSQIDRGTVSVGVFLLVEDVGTAGLLTRASLIRDFQWVKREVMVPKVIAGVNRDGLLGALANDAEICG